MSHLRNRARGVPSRRVRPRRRAGFTVVEAIVAVVMLAVGVLALASSSSLLIRNMSSGSRRAVAAAMMTERLERFRSYTSCKGIDTTIVPTVPKRGLRETWTLDKSSFGVREITYQITPTVDRPGASGTLASTVARMQCTE